jgi:serine/threonine-protein kinase
MGVSPKATTYDEDLGLKATLGRGSVDALADTAPSSTQEPPAPATSEPRMNATIAARTTVLPRRNRKTENGAELQNDERPRFELVEVIGRGGMGEVALVKDNDIRRTVAVKRLLPENKSGDAMLRFADEIRAVGQLEHPGIVPIYDVGLDDHGQHYLVMKHVQGETLESVIENLKSGDPEYQSRFTYEHRARIFLEILQAIRFAHERGIIHRDIKPANVMIGPFGEVTVMDWGVAKKIDRVKASGKPELKAETKTSGGGKLLATGYGALVGTPLYMSPEQAAGKNDELDERSDIYALSLLFYEMITLEHPLGRIKTLQDLLATTIAKDLDIKQLGARVIDKGVPVDYFQFLAPGLARDRDERYASVAVMEQKLSRVLSGFIPIMCHISLTKSVTHRFLHFVDRNPKGFSLILMALTLGLLATLVWVVFLLVR